MIDSVAEALILDLLDFVAAPDRTYEEAMAAWRTSCPRLPVSEDANDLGLVRLENGIVRITSAGQALLQQHGRVR